jgi:hypothetical protein
MEGSLLSAATAFHRAEEQKIIADATAAQIVAEGAAQEAAAAVAKAQAKVKRASRKVAAAAGAQRKSFDLQMAAENEAVSKANAEATDATAQIEAMRHVENASLAADRWRSMRDKAVEVKKALALQRAALKEPGAGAGAGAGGGGMKPKEGCAEQGAGAGGGGTAAARRGRGSVAADAGTGDHPHFIRGVRYSRFYPGVALHARGCYRIPQLLLNVEVSRRLEPIACRGGW